MGESSMVLVATRNSRRVRLAHADNNDEATLQRFADEHVAAAAATDGLASYNPRSLADPAT